MNSPSSLMLPLYGYPDGHSPLTGVVEPLVAVSSDPPEPVAEMRTTITANIATSPSPTAIQIATGTRLGALDGAAGGVGGWSADRTGVWGVEATTGDDDAVEKRGGETERAAAI